MSNLSRLEAVSSSLDTAINKANSLPDAGGGSSGGGSVETCDVVLSVMTMGGAEPNQYISHVVYTTLENGLIREKAVYADSMELTAPGYMMSRYDATITCVIGSPIVLFRGNIDSGSVSFETSDNITLSGIDNERLFVSVVNSFANDSFIYCT